MKVMTSQLCQACGAGRTSNARNPGHFRPFIEFFFTGSALKLAAVKVRQVKAGFKSRCQTLSGGGGRRGGGQDMDANTAGTGEPVLHNPQPAAQKQNGACGMKTPTLPTLKAPAVGQLRPSALPWHTREHLSAEISQT